MFERKDEISEMLQVAKNHNMRMGEITDQMREIYNVANAGMREARDGVMAVADELSRKVLAYSDDQ